MNYLIDRGERVMVGDYSNPQRLACHEGL